jgi:hypothetical protein
MKPARRRVDVNLDELDQVPGGPRQAPLSEADSDVIIEKQVGSRRDGARSFCHWKRSKMWRLK